jgi:hypothetical protein
VENEIWKKLMFRIGWWLSEVSERREKEYEPFLERSEEAL